MFSPFEDRTIGFAAWLILVWTWFHLPLWATAREMPYAAAVIVNHNLAGVLEHTVLGTVQLLADRGYWQVGAVVLLAGVAVPTAEIAGLLWLLARVIFPSKRGLVRRTRMYRVLHRLARWPMIIPFIAALAAPIIDYRGIDDIVAGPGATPLFMVIALIMLGADDIDSSVFERTMSIIVKHRTDLDVVAERVGVKLDDGLLGRLGTG